jgi:uncharacterized membrane protein/thiol-disulfide isomerase/thioredoxin
MRKQTSKKAHRSAAASQAGVEKTRAAAPDWILLLLAVSGMLLSGYLTFTTLSDAALAFCDQGSSCQLIQQSRWSRVLGVPLALWGFALYAVLAVLAWRQPSRLQRWRRLWLIALVGLVISLYLTLVGWIELAVFCVWCLLSLALLVAFFLRASQIWPKSATVTDLRHWLLRSGITALLAVAALHLYYSGLLSPRADPQLQALADHLQRSEAKFYGAFWCPACQEQKSLFGPAAEQLPYVECSPNGRQGVLARACIEENISGYPTWIIRGRRYQQVLSAEELARHSRFKPQAQGAAEVP